MIKKWNKKQWKYWRDHHIRYDGPRESGGMRLYLK